jgi:hypothetical protein
LNQALVGRLKIVSRSFWFGEEDYNQEGDRETRPGRLGMGKLWRKGPEKGRRYKEKDMGREFFGISGSLIIKRGPYR